MRIRLPVLALIGWTLVVWVGRIRNIVADDDLSGLGRAWRLGAAGFFVAMGLVVLLAWWRRSSQARVLLGVLAAWTVGWWSVRGIGILLDPNHAAGFKVVHTILMIVSIGLAMWAWARRDG